MLQGKPLLTGRLFNIQWLIVDKGIGGKFSTRFGQKRAA